MVTLQVVNPDPAGMFAYIRTQGDQAATPMAKHLLEQWVNGNILAYSDLIVDAITNEGAYWQQRAFVRPTRIQSRLLSAKQNLATILLYVHTARASCRRCNSQSNINDHAYCDVCTRAFTCASCAVANYSAGPCRLCRKCANCCICPRCNICHVSQQSVCEECCNCRTHCACAQVQLVNESYGDHWGAANPKYRKKFNCERTIGVEWEFNTGIARRINPWVTKWHAGIHHDGSCGLEAVTPPLAGDRIAECLTGLGEAFQEAVADTRCGIHVHVDAKDIGWHGMYTLLEMYSYLEPLLYAVTGPARMSNRYCKPCGEVFRKCLHDPEYRKGLGCVDKDGLDFEDYKGAILRTSITRLRTGMRQAVQKKDGGRYRGLNICPWLAGRRSRHKFTKTIISHAECEKAIQAARPLKVPDARQQRGALIHARTCNKGIQKDIYTHDDGEVRSDTTVEFRIHENTLDAERVIGWAQFCALLVEYAAKATPSDLKALLAMPRTRAFTTIAPNHRKWLAKRLKEFRKHTNRAAISLTKGFQCAV